MRVTSVQSTTILSDERPRKRVKFALDSQDDQDDSQDSNDYSEAGVIPPHPLGVKPSGNAYAASLNLKSHTGSFSRLSDDLLIHFLESLSDAKSLLSLGHTCKAFYAFTSADDLWRGLVTQSAKLSGEWCGSWRSTYLKLPPNAETRSIDCKGVFSDALYRPFFCSHTSLNQYAAGIPSTNAIARLPNLTAEEYSTSWTNRPFILTQPIKEWPIFGKWTNETLLRDYADIDFRAESVDWPMRTYISYMRNQTDESPLYLFDRSFASKMGLKTGSSEDHEGAAYWPPECFGEDLFSLLGDQRPDSRWMIMGPERSGSTFHKDPNGTNAWNAVLTGAKYWLMFPSSGSSPPPPGVIVSEDGTEVTAPVSIAEYLLSFHELARATPGCKEGICHAGEVLHVPGGWFHLVLNLDDSIALTGNFVPEAKLVDVLRFLRDTPENISGFREEVRDPFGLFVERLRDRHPELLAGPMEKLDGGRQGAWEKVKQVDADEGAGGFSFDFGADLDDDDDAEVP